MFEQAFKNIDDVLWKDATDWYGLGSQFGIRHALIERNAKTRSLFNH